MEGKEQEEKIELAQHHTPQDLKNRFKWLESFDDETLMDISYCMREGELKAGEDYFDLNHPERGGFETTQGQHVPYGSCYVEKSRLRPGVWQRLIRSSQEELH